uniref:Uncharacterized protein n=1 Tax=Ascaris lumbricoides TaxID=6252 RepID=A0A0M3HUG7_ASCLU
MFLTLRDFVRQIDQSLGQIDVRNELERRPSETSGTFADVNLSYLRQPLSSGRTSQKGLPVLFFMLKHGNPKCSIADPTVQPRLNEGRCEQLASCLSTHSELQTASAIMRLQELWESSILKFVYYKLMQLDPGYLDVSH